MIAQIYNPSTWEVKIGVQGQPGPRDNEVVLQRDFDDTANEQKKPGVNQQTRCLLCEYKIGAQILRTRGEG